MKTQLRRWRLSDAGELAAILSNKNILNNLRDGLPCPYTKKDAEDYINTMLSSDPNDTFAYAITLGDKAIGSIGVFRQGNIHSRTAELGYYLAEEYWGQGIMSDSIKQICAIVFDNSDIVRIFAEPFSSNTGSCRALEKAGFTYEGTLRHNAYKNGRIEDMRMYSATKLKEPYYVRRLCAGEITQALNLAWEVFLKFEAPEYSDEGVKEFKKALGLIQMLRQVKFYGAFDKAELIGTLAIRDGYHISLFFVNEKYHRKGVGKKLFETMKNDSDAQCFTVNSSPYAVEVYSRLGFIKTDCEKTTNGIRYTPMKYIKNSK